MIPENDLGIARSAFGAIHRNNPEAHDIENALAYLEKATFFDALQDEKKRDQAFWTKLSEALQQCFQTPALCAITFVIN